MRMCAPFKKALSTDSTATSFASKIPTVTRPSGSGVIDLTVESPTGLVPEWLVLIPYATSGDNDTMDMRVIGWQRCGADANRQNNTLYLPLPLAQYTCTMSAAVGIASAYIVATERFADTIIDHATIIPQERVFGTDSGGAQSLRNTWINSPANDLIGRIELRTKGAELIEINFDTTAGGTTAMNCLYAFAYDN